jgi:hypothetical protein
MFDLCNVDAPLADVWRNSLIFMSLSSRVQEQLKPHITLAMTADEFQDLAVRISSSMVDAPSHLAAASVSAPLPGTLYHSQFQPQLNYTTYPAPEGTRLSHLNMELHALRDDFSAVLAERELALADGSAHKPYDSTSAYLNNISANAEYGPNYPLMPEELHYISGGQQTPLDHRIQQYIAKIPPTV